MVAPASPLPGRISALAGSFPESVEAVAGRLSRAESAVVGYLVKHRETALHASAADIAAAAGTSDATVIRTARKLGYRGLDALREALAEDLRRDLTLSDRLANELRDAEASEPLRSVTAAVRPALDVIDAMPAEALAPVVADLAGAARVMVFGIGPSGFIAGYFAAQLGRLGLDARAMTRTGLRLADDLLAMREGDFVVALAYDRPYREVRALFDRAGALGLSSVLITSLAPPLPDRRARHVLKVPRGKPGGFGVHAGTLALLEGLLIAVSAERPDRARQTLEALNTLRRSLGGSGLDLLAPDRPTLDEPPQNP